MNRETTIRLLEKESILWDILVIGGGATGLGTAVDAASRGYNTLLLEKADFTKGTSSRSTKLVHGGVRYLAQGNIRLVLEALHERGLLLRNAPHLCGNQTFVVPNYSYWKSIYYTTGLKFYDLLAGSLSLGKSGWIRTREVLKALPTLKTEKLKNGTIYHDGQFDDARLGINLAQTATDQGGHVVNYMNVITLLKNTQGKIEGVTAEDLETGKIYELRAKVVINATGVFADEILTMDAPEKQPAIQPSQGTHIVLDRSFMPTPYALMIPETKDGRVLFVIPWHDKVLAGTTDVLVNTPESEPRASVDEVDFILETFGQYIRKKPTRKDILSVFSGLRPLARPEKAGKKTREISRNHKLILSPSNLITITGGKWTTYRKMAEDTIDLAMKTGGLKKVACHTEHLKIHGYKVYPNGKSWRDYYGSDTEKISELEKQNEHLTQKLHPDYPYTQAEVVWAVREEMARTVEDILARRLRILFLDARAAIDIAEHVAEIMAHELNRETEWVKRQTERFKKLGQKYLLEERL